MKRKMTQNDRKGGEKDSFATKMHGSASLFVARQTYCRQHCGLQSYIAARDAILPFEILKPILLGEPRRRRSQKYGWYCTMQKMRGSAKCIAHDGNTKSG